MPACRSELRDFIGNLGAQLAGVVYQSAKLVASVPIVGDKVDVKIGIRRTTIWYNWAIGR